MNKAKIIASVKYWLQQSVIGKNLCPFAKKEFNQNTIHYEVTNSPQVEMHFHHLIDELHRLDNEPKTSTSILIIPKGLEKFEDYLDFLELANILLIEENYQGVYQLASFHPDYCFDQVEVNDPANYTNRSPFPLVHILREDQMETAIANFTDTESIPQNNIRLIHEEGLSHFIKVLETCKNMAK
ncbi:MAG: DUF1415 domain-containing protein [Gammaproteobacteria bacterium]|nr:DUF1415 domain-containing protein [Gammaproteobacteria bacterium]MDH5629226.1 DUF1415 domain-containing protein [Gammaproteobacteria bacterium]